ncbi:MAG: hypothetical protein GY842_13105 [bacterium]|nr:hypothetical protein [bacterium]
MNTKAAINNGLKVLYVGQRMPKVVAGKESRVAFNDLRQPGDFEGDFKPIPVYWDDAGGGRSADLTVAQNNADEVKIGQFQIDVVPDNNVVRISTNAYLRCRSDKGGWIKQQALRVDNGLNNLANAKEKELFNSSHGAIGQVKNASFGVTTLDLVNREDAKRIQVGQKLVFSLTTTGALLNGGKALKVTKVSPTATTMQVTLEANLSTVVGMATNAYIFPEGDAANDGAVKKISGFPDWNPLTVTSTLFFNQDRTDNDLALGGFKATGKYNDISQALIDALFHHHEYVPNAEINVGYINSHTFARLVNQVRQDVQRAPATSTRVGYRYISIEGPHGEVHLKPATYCPRNTVYLNQTDTWTLESMLEAVRIDQDDGMIAVRVQNAKALEVRLDSHAQLSCSAPGNNIRVTLS